jgi:hypothetical protein
VLTDEEKEKILELKGKGYSDFRISKELGVDRKTVKRYSGDDGEDNIEPLSIPKDRESFIRERPVRGKGGPMSTLKEDAYRSAQYDFKTEVLEDERNEYRERKDRELKVRLEEERRRQQEENLLRQRQEGEERRKRERMLKIQKMKMIAIPAPLMATIPPHILSLTLSEIENGLAKVDIDSLSERELLIHAEAIRSRVWSDPAINREVKAAGMRAIFESLETYLNQEYETAVKKGYTKSFSYFLGEIYLGMTPIQQLQIKNFIEGR